MPTVIPDLSGVLADGSPSSLIDQIIREGARWMLVAALESEVEAYIDRFAGSGMSADAAWWCATARPCRGTW